MLQDPPTPLCQQKVSWTCMEAFILETQTELVFLYYFSVAHRVTSVLKMLLTQSFISPHLRSLQTPMQVVNIWYLFVLFSRVWHAESIVETWQVS